MTAKTDPSEKHTLVPEATIPILRELVDRKRTQDKKQKSLFRWGIALVIIFLIVLVYIIIKSQAVLNGEQSVRELLQSPLVWGSVGLQVVTYLSFLMAKKSYENAEEEFEELRAELIDRSTDLWADRKQWEKRHHVFEFMKSEYDINLYYE